MRQEETNETVHQKPGGKQETGRNCPGRDEKGNRIVGRRKERVGRISKETFSRCNIGEAHMSSSQLKCSKPMSATRVSSRGGRGRSRDKNVEGRRIRGRRRRVRIPKGSRGRVKEAGRSTDWVPRTIWSL